MIRSTYDLLEVLKCFLDLKFARFSSINLNPKVDQRKGPFMHFVSFVLKVL